MIAIVPLRETDTQTTYSHRLGDEIMKTLNVVNFRESESESESDLAAATAAPLRAAQFGLELPSQ